jgi:hypothetical protein
MITQVGDYEDEEIMRRLWEDTWRDWENSRKQESRKHL